MARSSSDCVNPVQQALTTIWKASSKPPSSSSLAIIATLKIPFVLDGYMSAKYTPALAYLQSASRVCSYRRVLIMSAVMFCIIEFANATSVFWYSNGILSYLIWKSTRAFFSSGSSNAKNNGLSLSLTRTYSRGAAFSGMGTSENISTTFFSMSSALKSPTTIIPCWSGRYHLW